MITDMKCKKKKIPLFTQHYVDGAVGEISDSNRTDLYYWSQNIFECLERNRLLAKFRKM